MDDSPPEIPQLREQAFVKLRQLLVDGGLRPGQFVSMPDLVRQLGLPIAPVREAVKRAEALSLVTVVPKRGAFVMDATPETIRHTFDLRAILDQEGARRLALRHDAKRIAALRQAHREVFDAAHGTITPALQQRAKEVDWSMHQTLADALDNPIASDLYAANRDRISILQHARPLLPDRIGPAMAEHLAILDCIAAGDAHAAAEAVRAHYAQTLRWWGLFD